MSRETDNNYQPETSLPKPEIILPLLPNKKQGFLLKICRLMKDKLKWLLFKSWVSLQWCNEMFCKVGPKIKGSLNLHGITACSVFTCFFLQPFRKVRKILKQNIRV